MLGIKINNNFYNYVFDIIDTKIYKFEQITKKTHKYICIVKFDYKAVEAIQISIAFNHPDIIKMLPCNLQKKDAVPTVTHKQGDTIRNKILIYKDVVNSVYFDEAVSFSLITDLDGGEKSRICHQHHKHIFIGNLRIIETKKLRKILTKSTLLMCFQQLLTFYSNLNSENTLVFFKHLSE